MGNAAATATDIRDIELTTIDGGTATLADYADKVVLVVNVASKCGLTPQYEQLEQLQKDYESRGFTVLGFPCNQFMGQEPGSTDEIKEFCSTTYGVTFPLMDKIHVNGRKRHPLYAELTQVKTADGKGGRIQWNFEKFVITPQGEVSRFRPTTKPDDPAVIAAIESGLTEVPASA
jgi:glutathione peroxidase